jgi:DNA-binding YbaB/EbfC family protein
MGTGFSKKKKQARLMQDQFMQMQDQMKNTTATGTAGNGLVTITLNGENEILNLKIKPECVDPEDVEGLEDLIKEAYKNASAQLKDSSPMPGGLPNIPGMPDLSSFGL